MNTIIDRLEWFMTKEGLNDNSLTTQAGLSIGLIGKARKSGKVLRSDTIEKILYAFPRWNGTWLLTGKGGRFHGNPNGNPDGNPTENNAHPDENSTALKEQKISFVPNVVMVDQDQNELIPIVAAKAAAGYLNGYADPEYIESLPALKIPGFTGRSYRGFEAKGQSMIPNIYQSSLNIGSFVERLSDVRDRRIYIIVTKNDGIVIKRVINHIEQTGKLVLISDNRNKNEFPNYTIDPEDVLEIWNWRAVLNFQAPEPYDIYNQFNEMQARITVMQEQIEQLQSNRLNK